MTSHELGAERDKAVEAHILPKANIDRMVIASLPPGSKSSIDSKVVLQYLASEMLAFVTSEADAVSKVRAPPRNRAHARPVGCDP